MIKALQLIINLLLFSICSAQRITPDNVPANREMAENQVRNLRSGTLVVRLKTNEKSIAAYRAAGKAKLADKLESENRERNLNLMLAFMNQFTFCPVVFIEANNTKHLLNHENNIYLNGKLEIDSSIRPPKGFYLIAEFGEAQLTEIDGDVHHSRSSATPGPSTGILIIDSDLNQLKEPFPYSVDMVFAKLNGQPQANKPVPPGQVQDSAQAAKINDTWAPSPFDKGVSRLSNRLESFYNGVLKKHNEKYQQWLSLADKPAFELNRDNTIRVIKHELEVINDQKEKFTK